MATTYTTVLRLAKPTSGELSGTWGDVVNDNITTMVEQAITGLATVAMADANQTLTTANGTTDQARCMMVECTGALTADRNVICPTQTKLYIVNNKTTGGKNIVFKTVAGTGITVAPSTSQVVYCDGVNVVAGGSYLVSGGALGTPASGTLTNCTGLPAAGVSGTALTAAAAVTPGQGGTGVANNAAMTVTGSGNYAYTRTLTNTTNVTFPTTGTLATLAGSETFTNKTITNPTITNYVETLYAPAANSAWTVDLANGTVQKLTTNANATITLPSSVAGHSYTIIVAYGGTHTVTWAGGGTLKWSGGSAPTATSTNGKFDIYAFTCDGTNTFGRTGGSGF